MKKVFLIFILMFTVLALSGGDFENKGVISNWKFAPLQVDVGLVNEKKLVDESSDTFISLGLFILRQKSAVISFAFLANTLQNNYGIQIPIFPGSATDNNYGISLGWDNYSKNCYGIQLGMINHSFAGDSVEKNNERVQFCGINIADTLYCGLVNFSDKFQIGLFNAGKGAIFQIGLLNYNPRSYIPWMPLINCDMGKKTK
ncbi:MAG: hypothetical protein IJC27_09920 [Lentisphaeria bacterium]|nr:hypothetical protein [Lentisphaeria bacterium]